MSDIIDDHKFDIVGEVCESSLIGYKSSLKQYDARDIADFIFLYCLALQILKSDFDTQPFANDYADHTISNSNFDDFRTSGTDLHILVHTLFGKNNSVFKLLDKQDSSKLLKDRLSLNTSSLRSWLNNFSRNKVDTNSDNRFLLKLESDLQINTSDYRSIRRLASEWPLLNQQQRSLAMTRLLFALKARVPRSELLPALNKLAQKKNLIIKDAKNPEKEGSSGKLLKIISVGAALLAASNAYKLLKDKK